MLQKTQKKLASLREKISNRNAGWQQYLTQITTHHSKQISGHKQGKRQHKPEGLDLNFCGSERVPVDISHCKPQEQQR
jgi:hypothetical protein